MKKMTLRKKSRTTAKGRGHGKAPSSVKLDEMIDEAIVDAYGESEQRTGFHAVIEANLAVPFTTEVLGVTVTVVRVDTTADDHIVAVCVRGRDRQRVPILDLPLPSPPPAGWEWIAAYRRWARGR
jgi:hypothetical protein